MWLPRWPRGLVEVKPSGASLPSGFEVFSEVLADTGLLDRGNEGGMSTVIDLTQHRHKNSAAEPCSHLVAVQTGSVAMSASSRPRAPHLTSPAHRRNSDERG